jgi:cytochrome c oxidase subunit 2
MRESIINPQAKIAKGFPNIMPTSQGQLSEEELISLIEYIKLLNGSK